MEWETAPLMYRREEKNDGKIVIYYVIISVFNEGETMEVCYICPVLILAGKLLFP